MRGAGIGLQGSPAFQAHWHVHTASLGHAGERTGVMCFWRSDIVPGLGSFRPGPPRKQRGDFLGKEFILSLEPSACFAFL